MRVESFGIIFDIKKYSLHDGPGIRTTIFLKGCPLNCAWCHNPEGISPLSEIHFWDKRCISCYECIDVCTYGALAIIDGHRKHNINVCKKCGACALICPSNAVEFIGTKISVSDLLAEIMKDVIYYDQSGGGVTFSGGEPLLQIGFLEDLLAVCKDNGIHTAIDTSGYAPEQSFRRIISLTDIFLFDLKIIDLERHIRFTGVPNQLIIRNLKSLFSVGANVIPRIPIIPNITDNDENIHQIGKLLQSLGGIKEVHILPYHRAGTGKYIRMGHEYLLGDLLPPSEIAMKEISRKLESYGLDIKIGG